MNYESQKKSVFLIGVILFISLVTVSCKSRNNDIFLKQSFEFAGENKSELEKVLKYFEKDSLKLEAAKFLIRNMPYHNYYDYDLLDTYFSDLYTLANIHDMDIESARDSLSGKYSMLATPNFNVKNDAKTIHSQFLIDNIEHAFMAWENAPWKNDVDFSLFCREILPYRVGHESVENWREAYYKRFKPILDSLSVKDAVTAVQLLYDSVVKEKWIFAGDTHLPHRNALFLLDKRMGSCAEYSVFMSYIMRSLAIPGGIDMIVQNPDLAYKAHYWNYVTDKSGNTIDFTLYEKRPTPDVTGPPNRVIGKVYRKNFEPQKKSLRYLYPDKEIPNSLGNFLLSDVSDEYIDGVDLVFDIGHEVNNNEIVYISVFNNSDWIPIGWSTVKKRKVVFENLEPGIVYALTTYNDKTNSRIDFPVLIQKDKSIRKLSPDLTNKYEITVKRKYAVKNYGYENMLLGGRFQASDNRDFSNAIDLYTITQQNKNPYDTIFIETDKKYKFIRYYSPIGGHCNMAEIKFFSEDNRELTGKIIGTDGALQNNKRRTKFKAFDNDPLSFYEGKDYYDSWVGLELEQPQKIKKIVYIFRNDDNYIRPNDIYELFYFSKNSVVSLGSKTGTSIKELRFDNVPENSLLWLRNKTRGMEERIFTYEKEQQIWW